MTLPISDMKQLKRRVRDPWWTQGRIGRALKDIRDSKEDEFWTIERNYGWLLVDRDGNSYVHLTLRGNSKQRRQQLRAILRYINGEPK